MMALWKSEKQITSEELRKSIAEIEAQSPPKGSDLDFQLKILKREYAKLHTVD